MTAHILSIPVEIWSAIIDGAIDLGTHAAFYGIVQIMHGALGPVVQARARAGFGPAQRDRFIQTCRSTQFESKTIEEIWDEGCHLCLEVLHTTGSVHIGGYDHTGLSYFQRGFNGAGPVMGNNLLLHMIKISSSTDIVTFQRILQRE